VDHAPGRYEGPETGGRKKKVTDPPIKSTAPVATVPETEAAASAAPQTESGTQPFDRPIAESAQTHAEESSRSDDDMKATGTAIRFAGPASSETKAGASPPPPVNKITVLEPPTPRHDHFNLWMLAAGVIVAVAGSAALFLINAEDPGFGIPALESGRQSPTGIEQRLTVQRVDEPELPESVKKQLAEAEKIRKEVERMKQLELEHRRTLEQAEQLKRERDAALANAQAEEEQRAREAERAKLAAERERAAEKALAAEKAAQAERNAKALAEKKRLAEQKRKQEQLKLEQEAREREKLRLEQEAVEQERLRLEQEARQRKQEEAQRLAREQEQKAERDRAEQAAAEQARIQQAEKDKNAGFSTDLCNGPSARFVSSCRK
jgi:hypothetical protein